jgi:hypothetical protein
MTEHPYPDAEQNHSTFSGSANGVVNQPARGRKEVTVFPLTRDPFSTHARRTYG